MSTQNGLNLYSSLSRYLTLSRPSSAKYAMLERVAKLGSGEIFQLCARPTFSFRRLVIADAVFTPPPSASAALGGLPCHQSKFNAVVKEILRMETP